MNPDDDSLAQAKAAAVVQRLRLRARAGATAERLSPSRLLFDARQQSERAIVSGMQIASTEAKAHPVVVGGTVALAIGWFLRRPLGSLAVSALDRMRKRPGRLESLRKLIWSDYGFGRFRTSSDGNPTGDGGKNG